MDTSNIVSKYHFKQFSLKLCSITLITRVIMEFRNPSNNYSESVSPLAWLWVLLFGFIYFAVKGVWRHAVASLVLGMFTLGFSWLVYPFFAQSIMKKHYLNMGWIPADENHGGAQTMVTA